MTTRLNHDDRVLLVKIDRSAADAADTAALYELTRKWWKASATQVQSVRRVLAIIENAVVAAYEPAAWEVATDAELQGRIAFHGGVAADADRWLGVDVRHLFPPGAANPVRYTTVSALGPQLAQPSTAEDSLILLLRVSRSWHAEISPTELYEATRGWWVMSSSKAERVVRVLAVAHGIVQEAYLPIAWAPCREAGEEHRIGFEGVVADDRDRWVGGDVSSVFPSGSQNPVRYVAADDLRFVDEPVSSRRLLDARPEAVSSPDLAELAAPLLAAFQSDVMWAMSRGAQELFHSNTIAALLAEHPRAAQPVAQLFAGDLAATDWQVWREWKHLDIVAESEDGRGRFVVENKLYSVPYPAQLTAYASKSLPWASGPGESGDSSTRYLLLSLMDPAFELPPPWCSVSYEQLLGALDRLDPAHFGEDAVLVERYRALVRRLVELKDVVDPRQDVEGPFAVGEVFGSLAGTYFVGPIQKMRFSGLAQLVSDEFGEQLPLDVDISKAEGSITFTRQLSPDRGIGWQFQNGQLRLFILVQDDGLAGKGDRRAAARAAVAEAEYVSFVDFERASAVLGERLGPLAQKPGEWRRFAPDFVYRYCKVDPATPSQQLARALAELTRHTRGWEPRG